jgi:hypothetical protein
VFTASRAIVFTASRAMVFTASVTNETADTSGAKVFTASGAIAVYCQCH